MSSEQAARGPLSGVRVLDFSALGPGPFATMMLADFGADVLCVRRPDPPPFDPAEGLARGKTSIGVDLRQPAGQQAARRLAAAADIVVESFRPGVMERLGLGPDIMMADAPRLIYARVTGWGQDGPYALRAGHDINYLAISGVLSVIGEAKPTAPPALLGDIANGSYSVVIGVMLALLERARTGRGQIVDAAIVDGAAYMLNALFGERAIGLWDGVISHHMLSGAAPFYGAYQCADGAWFSVGAIEPKFYASMLDVLGVRDVDPSPAAQMDRTEWPRLRARISQIFATRTQADWTKAFEGVDACGAPIVGLDDVANEPHLAARKTVTAHDGRTSAAPAPRLLSHPELVAPHAARKQSCQSILAAANFRQDEIEALMADKAVWSV